DLRLELEVTNLADGGRRTRTNLVERRGERLAVDLGEVRVQIRCAEIQSPLSHRLRGLDEDGATRGRDALERLQLRVVPVAETRGGGGGHEVCRPDRALDDLFDGSSRSGCRRKDATERHHVTQVVLERRAGRRRVEQ